MVPALTARTRGEPPGMRWIVRATSSASSLRRSRTRLPRRWRGIASHTHRIPATPTALRSLRLPALNEVVAGWLRWQAAACAQMGSPLYGSLLESAAADQTGATAEALAGLETETRSAAVGLRLMAAVHRLVLEGRLPAPQPHYPSVGGDGVSSAACPALRAALVAQRKN